MKFPLSSNRIDVKVFEVDKIERFIKSTKRNNSMNMRIPFEVTAKGMNNSNEPVMNDIRRSKVLMRRFRNFGKSLIFTVNIMKLIFEDKIISGSKFSKENSVIEEKYSALLDHVAEYLKPQVGQSLDLHVRGIL